MKRSEVADLARQDWLNDNSCESFVRTALKAFDAGAKGGIGDANEFDPNLPQYLWSDRRRAHEGAQQQAATSSYLAK